MLRLIRNCIKLFSFGKKDYGKVVFIQDPESKGYSAHYENFPETFGQGETKKEALDSLDITLRAVLRLEAEESATLHEGQVSKNHKRKLQHA